MLVLPILIKKKSFVIIQFSLFVFFEPLGNPKRHGKEMDFVRTIRAAENITGWKGIVVKSSL